MWTVGQRDAAKLLLLNIADFGLLVNAAISNPHADVQYLISQIQPDGSHSCDFASEIEWGQTRDSDRPEGVPIIERIENRAAFPLKIQHAETYQAAGVALVGDAAHTVHPLGGRGLNLGFGDVASLLSAVEDSVYTGAGLVPTGYTKSRYMHNALVLTGCDVMWRMRGRLLSFGDFDFIKKQFVNLMS